MDAFQCQHRDWKHAAILYVALELNNGAKVYANGTEVKVDGNVNIEGTKPGRNGTLEMVSARDGVNIMSDDSCIRININAVNLHGDLSTSNNFKVRVPQDAVNYKGVCGATKQWQEHIVRGEHDFLFSIEQWRAMCELCSSLGGLHPPNCPSPHFGQFDMSPGGEFLRPFLKENERECISIEDGDIVDQLQEGGDNSVVYAILEKNMSCRDFCRERASQCVTVRDNADFIPCNFTAEPSQADCDSTHFYDLNCVCKKPDLSAPGIDPDEACIDRVDVHGNAFTLEDASSLCKAHAPFLHRAVWDRKGCSNDQQCRIDFILGACITDVCNADPLNRIAIAKNAGDQDPRRAPSEPADRCQTHRLGRELCGELGSSNGCVFDEAAIVEEHNEFCTNHICEVTNLVQRDEVEDVGLLQRRNEDKVLAASNVTAHCSHRIHFCQRVCHNLLASIPIHTCMDYCDSDKGFAHVKDIFQSCC